MNHKSAVEFTSKSMCVSSNLDIGHQNIAKFKTLDLDLSFDSCNLQEYQKL